MNCFNNEERIYEYDSDINRGIKRSRTDQETTDKEYDGENDAHLSLVKRRRVRKRRFKRGDPKLIMLNEIKETFPTTLKQVNTIINNHPKLPRSRTRNTRLSTKKLVLRCWIFNQTPLNETNIVVQLCNSVMCILLSFLSKDILNSTEFDDLLTEDRDKMMEYRKTGIFLKSLISASHLGILFCPSISVRNLQRIHKETFYDLLEQLNSNENFIDEYISSVKAREKIIKIIALGWGDYSIAKKAVDVICTS